MIIKPQLKADLTAGHTTRRSCLPRWLRLVAGRVLRGVRHAHRRTGRDVNHHQSEY